MSNEDANYQLLSAFDLYYDWFASNSSDQIHWWPSFSHASQPSCNSEMPNYAGASTKYWFSAWISNLEAIHRRNRAICGSRNSSNYLSTNLSYSSEIQHLAVCRHSSTQSQKPIDHHETRTFTWCLFCLCIFRWTWFYAVALWASKWYIVFVREVYT